VAAEDVGPATQFYRVAVKDDYAQPENTDVKIDMTKEVPTFGSDRLLVLTVSDDKIEYEIRAK
jgi:hypothetical protein